MPGLNQHKLALLQNTLKSVTLAASQCLEAFRPYEDSLYWIPKESIVGLAGISKDSIITTGETKYVVIDDSLMTLDEMAASLDYLVNNLDIEQLLKLRRISGETQLVQKLRQVCPISNFALSSVIKDGIHHKVADLLRSYAQRMLDPQTQNKTTYPTIRKGFPIVWQNGFLFLENRNTGELFLYLSLFPRGGHQEDLRWNFQAQTGPVLQKLGNDKIEELKRTKGGLLLPLQFDKRGEATFIRDVRTPPKWKATHRTYDQRWLAELANEKDFRPKRIELFMRNDRMFVNVVCDVACDPPIETENFMGVAFGLQHLISIAVVNPQGELLHTQRISSKEYEELVNAHRDKGPFAQVLETYLYQQVANIIKIALGYRAVMALENVGDTPKGKYSPGMNRRLSFAPTGKLADILSYKAQLRRLQKPYHQYSATVRLLCAHCGEKPISIDGPSFYCGNCGRRGDSGENTALNLARHAQELHTKGVTAR